MILIAITIFYERLGLSAKKHILCSHKVISIMWVYRLTQIYNYSVFEWEIKKNRNALDANAEGVRRGAVGAQDRLPKARGVSMQLRGLGERCKLPSGSGRSPAAKRHLVHFWSENAFSGKAFAGEVLP